MALCQKKSLIRVGIALFLTLFLFVAIGYATYEVERYRPLSGGPDLAPFEKDPYNPVTRAGGYILGTDRQGRDVMAVMIAGIPVDSSNWTYSWTNWYFSGNYSCFYGCILWWLD